MKWAPSWQPLSDSRFCGKASAIPLTLVPHCHYSDGHATLERIDSQNEPEKQERE
jgi:hypothetical protein